MGDFFLETNLEVLKYIYKNASMGIVGIDLVLKKCKVKKFCTLITMQKEEYEYISNQAKLLIEALGHKANKISMKDKIISNFMINAKIKDEKDASVIAQMLLKGTNMGVLDITKRLNNYKITDRKVKQLAKTLKQILENNLEELKFFV